MTKFVVTPAWAANMPGTKIYALLDSGSVRYPRGSIRYIGRAVVPMRRLRVHWGSRHKEKDWHKPLNKWLRGINRPPKMIILAVVEDKPAANIENACIAWAWEKWGGRQILNRYMNGHAVRIGPTGRTMSAEHKAKISAALKGRNKGRKLSAETRAKISAANMGKTKGRKLSVEHKAKLFGARWTTEARAIQSEKSRVLWGDPDRRASMSAGMSTGLRDRWQDPEYRTRQSSERKARWDDPKYRAMMSQAQMLAPFRPCKQCGCPCYLFKEGCEGCQRRKRKPYWRNFSWDS